MKVIEIKEVPAASYKVTDGVPDVLNFDHCFLKSKHARVVSAFAKGLFATLSTLMISGYPICVHDQLVVGFVSLAALAFAVNEVVEQNICAAKLSNAFSSAPKLSLRSINPAFAAIPVVLLLSTMNVQMLMIALSNAIEVLGIACGVPFLMYGLIKMSQESHFGKSHVYVGSASAFGGIALSVVVNLIVSNGVDANIFSATNYFSNAIATIYAPDVVLQIDK